MHAIAGRDSFAGLPMGDRRHGALGDLQALTDDLLCAILYRLSCRDVGRLACVSSVFYILCSEEPLWMSLCLGIADGNLQYRGSWKKTALSLEQVPPEQMEKCGRESRVQFKGFSSLFLYRRFYRSRTRLEGFSFETGSIDRVSKDLTSEEFAAVYDGKKPVIFSRLSEAWPARTSWDVDGLLSKHGDTGFRISQRSSKKIKMRLRDYASYMSLQKDEDPLYIFDEKFGEVAPALLGDYSVPHLFEEDFFQVLDDDQRPPFRWLIIGPERSGASWHVDPSLTSAWNTLLFGRKRWALYPPGKVPMGVTVHVNEEDGDVHIESPSSLQWWMDFYPLIPEGGRPIECTQLPGETIYVPTGWWHCVLNLETAVAVTQNFVNRKNFEFVCLDMAPGFQHKGICRAGSLALSGTSGDRLRFPPEKRLKRSSPDDESSPWYDAGTLSAFLDREKDHFNWAWSPSNCIGQREMREWLRRLWLEMPHERELIWKGACLSMNAHRWLALATEICRHHGLPLPVDAEKLPVGTGSNPVYLIGETVIKVYSERGVMSSMLSLGTELQFYSALSETESPLLRHVPDVLASGLASLLPNGSHAMIPWDSRSRDLTGTAGPSSVWPYTVTRRCGGSILAGIRDSLSREELLELASFLGEQLSRLHSVPSCSVAAVRTRREELERRRDLAVKGSDGCWGGGVVPECLLGKKMEEYLRESLPLDAEECCWVHSDVMDDNICMETCLGRWRATHILDFSGVKAGDPLADLIPMYLNVFRGDADLMARFLTTYRYHSRHHHRQYSSYRAMCCCILHEEGETVLGVIFHIWKHLRTSASSWEQIEHAVWGFLDHQTLSALD